MSLPVRIAVADANSNEAASLSAMLLELGYDVVATASSAEGVLSQLSSSTADLMIANADLLFDLASADELRNHHQMPIIMLAPNHSAKQFRSTAHERVFGYLVRPFRKEDLATTIAVVMRSHEEFNWLQQQCQTYRNLINRLKQQVSTTAAVASPAMLGPASGAAPRSLTGESAAFGSSSAVDNSASTVVSTGLLPAASTGGVLAAQPTNSEEDLGKQRTLYASDHDRHLASLESIPHAVQEIDIVGTLTFSNAAHCRLHGYEPGELVGRSIWELLASKTEQDAFRNALEERIRYAPPPLSYVTRHCRRDGRVIDVQVDWTYKRDEFGEVDGFIAIVTDITRQANDHKELQQAREQIDRREARLSAKLADADAKLKQETDRRKAIEDSMRRAKRLASIGVLAAGIAHEINNPISAALSSAETALALSDSSSSKSMEVECLVNIIHSCRRCGNIVKDLLKFASQEPTEKRPLSLNHVVERALHIVRKVRNDSLVELRAELTAEPLNVLVNMLEIEIVVANLVQNAMEASGNHPTFRATVRTQRVGNEAQLIVEDNGCGIPESDLDSIFDPFFTTRKETGGTGLGLSIVYAIVRNHRGHIHVQSKVGTGTKFTLCFPLINPCEKAILSPTTLSA